MIIFRINKYVTLGILINTRGIEKDRQLLHRSSIPFVVVISNMHISILSAGSSDAHTRLNTSKCMYLPFLAHSLDKQW